MKVSKREKILLCALLVIGTLVVYYQFILSPKLEEIKQLEAKNIECDDRSSKLQKKTEQDKINKETKKNVQGKILTISQEIFPLLEGDDVIFILDNILNEIDIGANGFSMSQVTSDTFQPNIVKENKDDVNQTEENKDEEKKAEEGKDEKNPSVDSEKTPKSIMEASAEKYIKIEEKINKNSKDKSDKEKEESKKEEDNKDKGIEEEIQDSNDINKFEVSQQVEVPKVEVSLNYNTSYDNLRKFLNKLENYPRKFIVNNLSISASEENNVSGSMNIQMYCVPVLDEEYYNFFSKDLSGEKGKHNPFVFNRIDKKEIIVSEKKSKADFEMILKPTSSDFPSVILGKVEGSMNSKLMKNNENIEKVSVFLKEDNNKYYYRYEVGDYKYPQDGFEEFKPVAEDRIKFSILSTIRNSDEDVSGVNLNIKNETSIPVQVEISDDDKERKRVNKGELTGRVSIN